MFKFENDQRIFEIAGVNIGGQPGQIPTVLIGSIFYYGDKIVEDEAEGKFNKLEAEKLLSKEEELSEMTGNSRIIDVCCSNLKNFEKYIDFVANRIGGPFLIDGVSSEVRMAGARYISEVGLSERTIYNSITPEITESEIEVIKEAKINSAIILALNTRKPTISGRIEAAEELIKIASNMAIKNIMIDMAILDTPDPGPVGKAIFLAKGKFGLPAGCGAHNAIDMWRKRSNLEKDKQRSSAIVANTLQIAMGANFVLYGPLKKAEEVYFPCAVADAFVAYNMRKDYDIRPLTKNHPLYKIF